MSVYVSFCVFVDCGGATVSPTLVVRVLLLLLFALVQASPALSMMDAVRYRAVKHVSISLRRLLLVIVMAARDFCAVLAAAGTVAGRNHSRVRRLRRTHGRIQRQRLHQQLLVELVFFRYVSLFSLSHPIPTTRPLCSSITLNTNVLLIHNRRSVIHCF